MPISNLCSEKVFSVQQNTTLQQAATLMRKYHVGGLVVINADGKNVPVGIVTDRDIVISAVAEGLPGSTFVREVMSKNVVTVSKDSGIAETIDQMENNGVRRIVVTDKDGNACGVVSADDLLQLVAREMNGLGKLIERQFKNEKIFKSEASHLMT